MTDEEFSLLIKVQCEEIEYGPETPRREDLLNKIKEEAGGGKEAERGGQEERGGGKEEEGGGNDNEEGKRLHNFL